MKETLLLIEDEIELQQNLKEILEYNGFRLLTADHGEDAISKLNDHEIDLIICDIMMPIMDGFQFLEFIRTQEKFLNKPFIFLSAKARKEDKERGLALGADNYLTKPISARLLLNAVFSALNNRKEKELQGSSVLTRYAESKSSTVNDQSENLIRILVHHLEIQREAIHKNDWDEVLRQNELLLKCAQKLDSVRE